METPSTPILLTGIRPGAPVARAKETIARLLGLLGAQPELSAREDESPARPKLVLLKGGKCDPPDVA